MSNPFSKKNKPEETSPENIDDEVESSDEECPSTDEEPPAQETPEEIESELEETEELSERQEEEPVENELDAPSLTMDEISCRSCRFFEFEGGSRKEVDLGECRRMAPTPGKKSVASWPSVTWDTWCGEWVSGISNEDMVRMARAVAETADALDPAEQSQQSVEEVISETEEVP